MGVVYRAHDPRLGRDVAIKVSSERFTERFEREARAVASLNHPNICTLHDVGPDYLVMELVEGETLADLLAQRPRSSPGRALADPARPGGGAGRAARAASPLVSWAALRGHGAPGPSDRVGARGCARKGRHPS